MLEMPGGCSACAPAVCPIVSGLGLRVGDEAMGDGEGVLARGESGML